MQGSCVYVAPNGGIVHARDMSLAKNAGSSKQMLADLQLRAVSASLQSVLPEDRWVSWNHGLYRGGPDEAAALAHVGDRQARAAPARLADAEPVLRRAVVVGAAQFAANRGVPEAELAPRPEKGALSRRVRPGARARGSSS